MEAFPAGYTEHNLPLVVLSGLGQLQNESTKPSEPALREDGTRIALSSDVCAAESVPGLLEQLLWFDGSDDQWNPSALPNPAGRMKFRIKTIGRTYALPPRKAAPLAQPTSTENSGSSPRRSTELHSPLSPLSPGSPLYPNGVFTPVWFAKHQQHVPALIIAFFDLVVPGNGSTDDQIKADVNAIRAALTRSGYKTKFAAVLISNRSILQEPGLEDRIASIRRSTGLDSKLGLFFMPPMSSSAEVSTFVETMMKTLQPSCVEFYRDLTKHARRKKARVGPSPAPSSPNSNASQALSVPGWNVRYEIKQGVFAEFRQEMDVAERHYLTAIDELFADEGILESMPTWSPRWNEARLLSDCLSVRVMRSQLWNSATTSAAQFWNRYRLRIRSMVDRRGKGSQTYSWAAWEAKWAESMAQLIRRAGVPSFQQPIRHSDDADSPTSWQVYAVAEKQPGPVDRIPPFYNLHHPGYWLRLAARNARIRRQRALSIPAEDRVPPGQSPASTVVKRSKSYDLYLAPEPHEESPLADTSNHDHTEQCTVLSQQAMAQFNSRSQTRIGNLMRLDIARDFANAERYEEALETLRPLLENPFLRSEGWTDILSELLHLARQCAQCTNTSDVVLAATYELLIIGSASLDDFSGSANSLLERSIKSPKPSATLNFQNAERLCPVRTAFAFESKDTSVGETLGCQLVLFHNMDASVKSLTFSTVDLSFDNGQAVRIRHEADRKTPCSKSDANTNNDTLELMADLTIRPTSRRILNFSLIFRESKTIRLTGIDLAIESEALAVKHTIKDEDLLRSEALFDITESGLVRKDLLGVDSTMLVVAPKPPKVQIRLHGQKKRYYTDEKIRLDITLINGEEKPVQGKITARVLNEDHSNTRLGWSHAEGLDGELSDPQGNVALTDSTTKSLERVDIGASHKADLIIAAPSDPAKLSIEISTVYAMVSDTSTTIEKGIKIDLEIMAPFEPTSSFGPVLFADSWPGYFDPQHGPSEESPEGIPQLWCLNTQLQCVTSEKLFLHHAELEIESIHGDSAAQIRVGEQESRSIEPKQRQDYVFELYTQKHSLDDRRPTSIESTMKVTWSREPDASSNVTRLALPRLTLPVSEPRVLCTRDGEPTGDGCAVLSYHVENPSTHFLTFALTMEASEEFAFSGPKYHSLSLAPLSRHRVEYRVLPQDRSDVSQADERWIWPSLHVVDSYYQKTLRVLPGGPHVKLDEKQNIGVRLEN